MSRRIAGALAFLVVLAWLVVPMLLAAAGCGSPAPHTPAQPPSHRPTEPPPRVDPPPVEIVEVVTVRVIVDPSALPIVGARVTLAPGIEARTDAQGAATFARLEAGAYTVTLADLPPLTRQRAPVAIHVAHDAREWLVSAVPTVAPGRVALLGDSDSSEPVPWRTSSVDDHLGELAPLLGWPGYASVNLARECTSAAQTPCPNRGIEQARRLPADVSVAVLRFGLNDLHFEESPGDFGRAYREIVAEVQRRGALPILVAPQEEERPEFGGRRAAYLDALVAIADDTGALYVDPRIEWPGDRDLYDADGIHLDDEGTRVVADAVLEAVIAGLTVGEEAIAPPPPPAARCDSRGFKLGISDYGLASAERSDIDATLAWLVGRGVCLARVWANWQWTPDGQWAGQDASAFRADGSVREERMSDLVYAADRAADLGVVLDLTLDGERLDGLDAHKRAARELAARFAGHPGVAIIDGCNECEFLNVAGQRAVVGAIKQGDPYRLTTISLSGDPGDVVDGYRALRDVIDLAAPHWPRVNGWDDDLAPLSADLAARTGLGVYLQEEAREGYEGDSWGVDAYVDACRGACSVGAWGYVQHTSAGFQPHLGSLPNQLDPITLEALTIQGADRCGCAP